MLVAVIMGVVVANAILGWMMWRGWKSSECAESDLRHRRRVFVSLGLIYVAAVATGIAGVLSGREPKGSLIDLPIALLLAWFYLRTGIRVKVPPRS